MHAHGHPLVYQILHADENIPRHLCRVQRKLIHGPNFPFPSPLYQHHIHTKILVFPWTNVQDNNTGNTKREARLEVSPNQFVSHSTQFKGLWLKGRTSFIWNKSKDKNVKANCCVKDLKNKFAIYIMYIKIWHCISPHHTVHHFQILQIQPQNH